MPAAKRPQDNTLLYTLITFVGLFIIATTVAVIFYVKSEEHRKNAADLQSQRDELASSGEWTARGKIVGAKQSRETYLGKMVDYLDAMVYRIIGGPPEDTSAEVKVDTANRKVKETLDLLAQERFDIETVAPMVPTNEFVKLLAAEQFVTAVEHFDETMKNALPVEKLEEAWKFTTSQVGAFKRQMGSRTEKQGEYDTVFVTCEFEKGPLDVKVVYNSERQVAGLFFVPTPPEVLKSYQRTLEPAAKMHIDIETIDPNTTGLITVIEKLKTKLDNTTSTALATQKQLEELQNGFKDAMAVGFEKEQRLLVEKERYQQQVKEIKQDYNELEALMKKTTEEQVQTLRTQRDEARANLDKEHDVLLKTQAELKMTEDRMKRIQEELQAIVPSPDSEVAAYKPDGKIILIDDQAKIVHLDIGSDDRVYPGLTFSVYDKGMPIPKDGKGKAEIEVFDVAKNFSAARIITSKIKRPIIQDDIIANLIWDSDKTNVFVVAGEFDIDGDGIIDYDAVDKIKALIEKWGGRVDDTVSIDTDFLVLGRAPQVLERPTFEQLEVDPMAMEKYEASLQKLSSYKEVRSRAQTLWIPVFNYERFLYFIGYKTQSGRAGAF